MSLNVEMCVSSCQNYKLDLSVSVKNNLLGMRFHEVPQSSACTVELAKIRGNGAMIVAKDSQAVLVHFNTRGLM